MSHPAIVFNYLTAPPALDLFAHSIPAPFAVIRYGMQHERHVNNPHDITLGTPLLMPSPNYESWQLPPGAAIQSGWYNEIGYVLSDELLFAHLLIPEPPPAQFTQDIYQAYSRLLTFVQHTPCPHLLRVWHYLASINDEVMGVERYHAFCTGRTLAYTQCGIDSHSLPAATAIGTDSDGISIHLLAGRHAGIALENPRQISAYHYPRQYGSHSPAFARAVAYSDAQQHHTLMISGTASIVGHVTMHPNHLQRQLQETRRNLERIINKAQQQLLPKNTAPLLINNLKVYLRHPTDVNSVNSYLRTWLGETIPILYLQGAICRRDLMLEIEVTAHAHSID